MPSKKKGKGKSLSGVSLYNKILKELTAINKVIPKDKKLTLQKRRQMVSEVLYPVYSNLPARERTLKNIRRDIKDEIDRIPAEQTCHPLYFPDNLLTLIDYFTIDEFIRNYLPDCIDIRVNAGYLGVTKIFNTGKYGYYSSGVRDLVERIREELAKNESGVAFFEGLKKVKPNKKHDLEPESYFIDFVLIINDEKQDDEEPIEYKLPKGSAYKKKKISADVEKKMKGLIKEKQKNKRIAQKEKEKVKLRKSVREAKTKSKTLKRKSSVDKAVEIALKTLLSAYRKKAITKKQYESQKETLLKLKKQ
jgi:hypothetical protein